MIVYQVTVNDCLPSQIAQKIFKLKIEAHPVNAGHYMAFKHCISFVTDLAANFGCDRIRIMPDIVSKLLRTTIWSSCAVQFEPEQTPFPRTGCISFATYLIQNHARHRFQAFARRRLKLLCCLIRI